MLHSDILINKLSRRAAFMSIASIAGFIVVGCGTTAKGASTPMAKSTSAATATSIPTSTPTATATAPTPTSVPSAQPGTTLVTYRGHTSSVLSVVWSPDSKFVASAEQVGTVQVWNAATGKQAFLCQSSPRGKTLLTWSANGKYIAGTNAASIFIWNASNGSLITKYSGSQTNIMALAFSPDSTRLATGASDKTVQIWQTTTGTRILTYNGHNTANGEPVVSLSWSPDGTQMVSSASSRGGAPGNTVPSVKVWNTATGKDILVFNTKYQANSVAWSPNGTFIASEEYLYSANYLNGKETIQIWAAENGRGLALTLDNDGTGPLKISWSPNNKYVALALASYQALLPNSRVEVRSADGGSYRLDYTGHQSNVVDVAWSPDGSRIASCSYDKTVQIWQAPA